MEQVIRELARFLDEPFEEVKRRVESYSVAKAAECWHKEHPCTAEEVEDFYRKADFYLYELIPWNYGSPVYQERIEPLLHYRGKRILEVGAGIGSLCISLAYAGNEVSYYDLSPKLTAFARQRFSERGLHIPILETLNTARDFDIIVANDVFEHIHPDALSGFVKTLTGALFDDGFIYHRSNFAQQDIFPMHFDHNKAFAEACSAASLIVKPNGDLVRSGRFGGVQIGIPTRGPGLSNDEIFFSFVGLQKPPGTSVTKMSAASIDLARNQIVAQLTKDWLFFMDDDQTFPPETLMRLLSWDLPVISGLYFKSPGKPIPHIYSYDHEEQKEHPPGYEKGDHFYLAAVNEIAAYLSRFGDRIKDGAPTALLPATKEDLIECDGVGAGCLLVHRRVFEAIEKPYFLCNPGTFIGEDFYFCRKVQAAGFKIYADPGVICGHRQKDLISYRHFMNWFTHATENAHDGRWPYPWNEP